MSSTFRCVPILHYSPLFRKLTEVQLLRFHHFLLFLKLTEVPLLAIVLQCGADSLAGDRLGVFHLSVSVYYPKEFPLLLEERCPRRQKWRVEPLKAKVEPLFI